MLPFTVLDADKVPAGMTTYMNIDVPNRRLEIGSTWYRQSCSGTALNTQCKLMLLTYAFEDLDCIAVEFRTHVLNSQSRKGIERLGAKLDGHPAPPHDPAQRHAARHGGLQHHAEEWPMVKAHLDWQLTRPR
jgi:RimJ/RimL family protein N-acetyltransferase